MHLIGHFCLSEAVLLLLPLLFFIPFEPSILLIAFGFIASPNIKEIKQYHRIFALWDGNRWEKKRNEFVLARMSKNQHAQQQWPHYKMFRIVIELLIDPIYLPNFVIFIRPSPFPRWCCCCFGLSINSFLLCCCCASRLCSIIVFLLSEYCSLAELHILDHRNVLHRLFYFHHSKLLTFFCCVLHLCEFCSTSFTVQHLFWF